MSSVSDSASPQAIAAKRVGVIGGGQLAWMMAEAARDLQVQLVVQTSHLSDPAVAEASGVVLADIQDAQATAELARQCDVITFENEFVNLEALSALASAGTVFYPSLNTLSPLLDKYDQRQYLAERGFPTPHFTTRYPDQAWDSVLTDWTFPFVLKARRNGYDGQGTFIIPDRATLLDVSQKLGNQPVLIEEFVAFTRELAVMVARSQTGEISVYPVVETQQKKQVCHWVLAPADLALQTVQVIEEIAHRLASSLDLVGIVGIELFLTSGGQVLVNELAPRTHNSGHYTIEACITSQFAQQLRAVCGLPLGQSDLRYPAAVMVNLLGYESAEQDYGDKRKALSAIPGATVHWYSKNQARPGRKLGHVTVTVSDVRSRTDLLKITEAIESIWYEP